ncbi:trypsin-like serine peptidase [Kitasatospora sp. NBC_01539]|uniref:trypsin-like serine peptidase n=1 Tax=Kitasatospora sp. NBC_01539 TaxID=2903577 RepID=UPI0038601AC9
MSRDRMPRRTLPRVAGRTLLPLTALLLAGANTLGLSLVGVPVGVVASVRTTLGTTAVAPADGSAARVGALFTGGVGPGRHFCSASVLQSPTRDLVVTAAHCVGTTDGLLFVPGYRDGTAPYGSWKVTRIFTTAGWSAARDPDEDFAVLRIAPNGGHRIEDVVGGNALGLDDTLTRTVRLYGYPSGSEAPLLCTNAVTAYSATQRRIECPGYPGGTSGGPWISTRTGEVIGVIGGYQEGGDTPDVSYTACFGAALAGLYRQAVTDTA